MEDVFRALADPSRRQLLDALNVCNGQNLRELCAVLEMTRQSVSKHLAVLEGANLVTIVWRGREKLHYLNAAPIADIAQRWVSQYDQQRVHALSDLKAELEGVVMNRPEFVYTTYIRTTPRLLWEGLTDPAFTRRYWGGVGFDSDWQPGSTLTLKYDTGLTIADPAQVVLRSEPYHLLSYTWHTFTPEWAAANGITEERRARFAGERRSRVTFTIEDVGEDAGEMVKLTVVHDDFDPGSAVLEAVSGGWPRILSDLKSLLEISDQPADQPQGVAG
jgi:uncharacterized protein YndB with AHSA1/START domain/DNA-binding transcriptional ArsR family regulator